MADQNNDVNLSHLEVEVQHVKRIYGKNCRVISDVGDFKYVVIIKPEDIDISVKFQLTGEYPAERPCVIVRSESIATDCLPEIDEIINRNVNYEDGSSAIDRTIRAILSYLKLNGLDVPPDEPKTNSKSKRKGKKKKKETKIEEQVIPEKKSSMKTAEDVIKRIQWDSSLSSESFLVGYLDRFTGIVEKGFTAFSWDDISSVDYNTLAIPKHRIQYFKYKDVIIWDKNCRLDYMFGSTGNGVDIHDVIENYDDYREKEDMGKYPKSKELLGEDFRSDHHASLDENFAGDLDYSDEQNDRPTHFICVKITDPEIKTGIEAMQDSILEVETRYASCCSRPKELHVTLCTLALNTVEQISDACQALNNSQKDLVKLVKDLSFTIEGVDNFDDRVIYGKVLGDKPFIDFAAYIKIVLKETGVNVEDNRTYVPHLTIMKVSRPIAREMGTKTINRNIYEHFGEKINMYFGRQKVDKLYLCEMNDKRGDDGFYVTPCCIDLEELLGPRVAEAL